MPVNRLSCLRSKRAFPLGIDSAQFVRDARLSTGWVGGFRLGALMAGSPALLALLRLSATCVLSGLVALLPGIRKESTLIGKMDSSARLADQASKLQPVANPSAVLSSKSLLASQLSLKQCFRWLAERTFSLQDIKVLPTCQSDASTLLDGPYPTP